MKSKLFLSLSLLTAVFSQVNASVELEEVNNLIDSKQTELAVQAELPVQTELAVQITSSDNNKSSKDELPAFNNNELFKDEFPASNKSYMQIAKDGIASGCNTVKTTAYNLYTNATYANMKNGIVNGFESAKTGTVNGFNTAKTFAVENPYKTTGAVAASAALVYGAYKLYNSKFFAKSKVQTPAVVTPVVTPVKKAKRILPRKSFTYAV